MKSCEFKWDLTYNRRLRPYTDAPALRFGSLVHKALAGWYVPGVKRGEHPRVGFEKAYEADLKRNQTIFQVWLEDEDRIDARELGVAMMDNYTDEYGDDDEWEVIVTEHPFQSLVRDDSGSRDWFYYVGIIDGLWRHRPTKRYWVPDHKTTKGIGGTKRNPKIPPHLLIDDQAGGYWSHGVDALRAAGLIPKGVKLDGMMYNYLRKALPDERPSKIINGERIYLNKDGSVSKKQPAPRFARIKIIRDEYDRNMAKHRARVDFNRIEMLRAGKVEITKTPGDFTCPWCPVRDACELHETGGDWEGFLGGTMEKWDPYDAHEIYDGR